MQRRESIFQTKFSKWAFHRWPDDIPAYFELKASKENELSIPFNAVSEKQNTNLKVRKFTHKFSDFDRMGTPFDMVVFCGTGYVVLYYHRRANKEFFIIPIDTWLTEKETSKRKSLLESRAKEIGSTYLLS